MAELKSLIFAGSRECVQPCVEQAFPSIRRQLGDLVYAQETGHRAEIDGYSEPELLTAGAWGLVRMGRVSMSNPGSIDMGIKQESCS